MAIQLTGLSGQSPVNKNERTLKEDSLSNSTGSNQVKQSANTMAEDTVKLSGAAQVLQNQQTKMNQFPEINMDKVEQIKNAIASGDYKIDTQKLASNMASMDSLF